MNEKVQNLRENGLPTNLHNVQPVIFSALFLLLAGSGPKRPTPIEKFGQFFAGFFHISKRSKTALQLNRTETLKPDKKNAHVILFTHRRA